MRSIPLLLAALLAAGPVLAQPQGGAMRPAPGDAGPRPAGRTPAAMLLRGRNELALTDDQIKRLEALAAAQSTSLVPPASAMMRARADLMDATKGDGDLAAARRAMERLAQIRTDAMLARLKARQEARAILSAEQKAKLVSLEQEMRGAIRRGARGGQGRRGWRGGRGAAPDEMRGPGRGGMPGEGRGRPMPRGPGNPSDD